MLLAGRRHCAILDAPQQWRTFSIPRQNFFMRDELIKIKYVIHAPFNDPILPVAAMAMLFQHPTSLIVEFEFLIGKRGVHTKIYAGEYPNGS
jgi:hypothetical protein